MLTLVVEPDIPDHLRADDDGTFFARDFVRRAAALPAHFSGPAQPEGWNDVHFAQRVGGDETVETYRLQAWWNGLEMTAPARNLRDYVDVCSCAGLLNTILADVVRSDVRIWVHEEDDVARAIAGTPEAVRALTSG